MDPSRTSRPGPPWLAEVNLDEQSPYYSSDLGALFLGDSLTVLQAMPANCVDLVMTSPPFAFTRQKEYGNEPIDRYLSWLMPFCEQILRILKPSGSFVLDIGGAWEPGASVSLTSYF